MVAVRLKVVGKESYKPNRHKIDALIVSTGHTQHVKLVIYF